MQNTNQTSGPRIIIVGVTGAGKTTTAQKLSTALGIPYVELDAIHWLPNWEMVETGLFRQKVTEITAADTWILDGNYRKACDLIWARATTLVWLDYSFPRIFWQLISRSMRRIITQEELWNGNRESVKGMFFSKESLLLWAIQSYPAFRKAYPELLAQPENAHLQVIRLRSPQETRQFLETAAKNRQVSGTLQVV